MRIMRDVKKLCAFILAAFLISGCSSLMVENQRAVSVEDILNMTRAGVSADIIIRQIDVTHSLFRLDPDRVIRLKEAGIDEKVIEAMIDMDEDAEAVDLVKSYSLYDYWFNYYNTFYPMNLYAYPVYPVLYDPWSPGISPVYRWSGGMGRYYRDFPVGLPRRIPQRYLQGGERLKETGRYYPQSEDTRQEK